MANLVFARIEVFTNFKGREITKRWLNTLLKEGKGPQYVDLNMNQTSTCISFSIDGIDDYPRESLHTLIKQLPSNSDVHVKWWNLDSDKAGLDAFISPSIHLISSIELEDGESLYEKYWKPTS